MGSGREFSTSFRKATPIRVRPGPGANQFPVRPRGSAREILPGILATLALWLITGIAFGRYLADFAFTYSVYYAGLAAPIIALVFLYWSASIFIYGGELNAVIKKLRSERAKAPAAA